MDEILIEEKRYISSKRAAKITGYAKDYIGQLCREGRVPARLVGRSWYVLEAAIQDHRFGASAEAETEPVKKIVEEPKPIFPSTWEVPRYEVISKDTLPPINRPKETEPDQDTLQGSWKTWFDNFHAEESVAPEEEKEEEPEKIEEPETKEASVDVPVRTVYEPLPKELLPQRPAARDREDPEEGESRQKRPAEHFKGRRAGRRIAIRTVQAASILIALVIASIAVIGSGYMDAYIISYNQVDSVAGVLLYNK